MPLSCPYGCDGVGERLRLTDVGLKSVLEPAIVGSHLLPLASASLYIRASRSIAAMVGWSSTAHLPFSSAAATHTYRSRANGVSRSLNDRIASAVL